MKMYVLLRKDLGDSYKFVQGTHALAQYAIDYPQMFSLWNNSTIVVLEVDNENLLYHYSLKLKRRNIKFSSFYESDIGNQLTAISCYFDGKLFKYLKLA